jgi:hypothetical protein
LAELTGGVAFLETFAREDAAEGDEHGFQPRPARFYRQRFEARRIHPTRLALLAVSAPARDDHGAGNGGLSDVGQTAVRVTVA